MGYYIAFKKKEIVLFSTTWTELLSDIIWVQKDKHHIILLIYVI